MSLPTNDRNNRVRNLLYFIVFLIFFDILVLSYYFFKINNRPVSDRITTVNYDRGNAAYFTPPTKDNFDVELTGVVKLIPVSLRDSKGTHLLVDANGKTIAQLLSTQHDLELFNGLKVSLAGVVVGKTVSDVDLVDVKNISLK